MGKCTEGLQGPCMRLRQELPAITASDHLENPATGASIPQGLSHVLDAPTIPEGVACSPLSGTTCLSTALLRLCATIPMALYDPLPQEKPCVVS